MSDVVVVDTSIALKWVLREGDSPQAEALLDDWFKQGITIVAPSFLAYEIANALYQKSRKGEIDLPQTKKALKALDLLGISFNFPGDFTLSRRALELANSFNLPATYDAHYLALAEQLVCDLWTADTRMWNSIQGKLTWVRWLGNYKAP